MRIYAETPLCLVPPRGVVIAPDWDRPTPQVTRPEDVAALRARLVDAFETETVRLLACWVSELDPVIVYAPGGGQLGLALAGDPEARIVVPSRLSTLDAIVAEVTGGMKPV